MKHSKNSKSTNFIRQIPKKESSSYLETSNNLSQTFRFFQQLPKIDHNPTPLSNSRKILKNIIQPKYIRPDVLKTEYDQDYSQNNISYSQNQIQIDLFSNNMKRLQNQRKAVLDLLQDNPNFQKHINSIQILFTNFKQQQDDFHSKYMLSPQYEKQGYDRQISIEEICIIILKNFINHLMENQELIDKKNQEIEEITKQYQSLEQKNHSLFEQLQNSYKTHSLTNNTYIKQSLIGMQKKENTLQVRNALLNEELQKINSKLEIIENDSSIQNLKTQVDNLQIENEKIKKQYSQQQIEKEQKLRNFNAQLMTKNSQIIKLEEQKDILLKQNKEIVSKFEYLEKRGQQLDQYRERMMMQMEDSYITDQKMQNLKVILKNQQQKIKIIYANLSELEKQNERGLPVPDKSSHIAQQDYFSCLKSAFILNQGFVRQLKQEYQGIDPSMVYKIEMMQKQDFANKMSSQKEGKEIKEEQTTKVDINSDDPNSNSYQLSKYAYYRPSFFCFIEQKYKVIYKSPQKDQGARMLTPHFLTTMRSILDAKFNEFIQCPDYRTYTKFSDFVYGFLGTFQSNSKNYQIETSQYLQDNPNIADDARMQFYMDLHSQNASYLWEVLNFREFLNEDASNDEIFFYLYCRNMLFKGPQMDYHEATFQSIHMIKIETVIQVVKVIMSRFDQNSVDFITNSLKIQFQNSQKSKKQILIDASLVLKTLLEIYRVEKISIFKLSREMFMSQQGKYKDGKYVLGFESFRKIFQNNNFPNTLQREIAYLYRECYAISKGMVTYDIFFTVCNETNFFVKNLKLKLDMEMPVFNQKKQIFEPENHNSYNMQQFYDVFWVNEDRKQEFLEFLQLIQSMGSEDGANFVQNFKQFMNSNMVLSNLQLQGKNIYQYFKDLMDQLINYSYVLMFQHHQNYNFQQIYENGFDIHLNMLQKLVHDVNFACQQKYKMRQIVRQNMIIKIQRKFRKIIQKYYLQLHSVLSAFQIRKSLL